MTEHPKEPHAANASSGWVRRGGYLLALGLGGIVLLLVLAPMAQATTNGPATLTLKAPYLGATSYLSSGTSNAGCGTGTIAHGPLFNTATGRGAFSLRAHSSACSGSFGDFGSSSASITVSVPIPAYTGTNQIHAKWTVHGSVGATSGGSTCVLSNMSYSYCYAAATASVNAYAYLVDLTTSTYYAPAHYWAGAYATSSLYDYCYAGSCTANVSGNSHLTLSTTLIWSFYAHGLNASHSYVLEFSWYASAYVDDYTYLATLSGASQTAAVTMAGPGMGATLDWITVR